MPHFLKINAQNHDGKMDKVYFRCFIPFIYLHLHLLRDLKEKTQWIW